MNAGKRWHSPSLNPEVSSNGRHAIVVDEKCQDLPPSLWGEKDISNNQTIEQVWFPGGHSDVRQYP